MSIFFFVTESQTCMVSLQQIWLNEQVDCIQFSVYLGLCFSYI